MTISSDSVKNSYAGNGTTKDFAITFTYFDNSEIQVYLKTDSTGAEVLKALTTHYTISGSPGSSPLVSMGTAPASGETLLVKRNTPFTQLTDYTAGDAFPADSHEAALDKLAALCQQLKETLSRSWTFPHSYSTLSDVQMPVPANNGIIKWNADATALVMDTTLALSGYKLQATTSEDTTPGFLNDKLTAGTGISKTQTTGEVNQQVTLNVDAAQTQIISVGALADGSIASGFGTISTTNGITTSGAVSAGTFAGAALDNTTTLGTATDKAATQNAVKTYVDTQVAAINDDATTTNKGVASFSADNFAVSSGAVTIKTGGVDNDELAGSIAAAKLAGSIPDSKLSTISTAGKVSIDALEIDGATEMGAAIVDADLLIVDDGANGTEKSMLASRIPTYVFSGITGDVTIADGGAASIGSGVVVDADIHGSAAIAQSKLNLSITNSQVNGSAGIVDTKLATISTANKVALTALDIDSGTGIDALADADLFIVDDGAGGTNKKMTAAQLKTYAGGGGGAGSIDTLFTMQAKSAAAAYTARGNGYVWSGTGSITNATLELETTALDLIQSEKVFAYDSSASGVRNWWYHEQAIQTGYGGKNMILQLQYFTRNCADSNIFRFYARDAAKPVFTSDGSADAGTNQILGAASWDATLSTSAPDDRKAAAVGDRIVIVDTSNVIHYRYITAVSPDDRDEPGALTITYSGADIAPADSTVMLIGVMTDELDYLPANNMAAAGNNEAKVYRKQMQFPEGCRLFQFGFHVESTDTDVELYYDDIALSANQFLQTSSQGQSESYQTTQFGGFWNGAGATTPFLFNTTYLAPGGNTPTLANSKLIQISDVSSKTRIIARQNIKLDLTITNNSATHYATSIYNSSGQPLAMEFATAARWDVLSASVTLNKNDYVYLESGSNVSSEGGLNFTATPQVNDVILLNSQDEIFTDWVSYTPTFYGSTSQSAVFASWRRIGSDMEIRVAWTGGTADGNAVGFDIPTGYSLDFTKINTGNIMEIVGPAVIDADNGGSWQLGIKSSESRKIFHTVTNGTNSRFDPIAGTDGAIGTGAVFGGVCKVPIAGWTSTFNPVLSMPLVDLGGNSGEYLQSGINNIVNYNYYSTGTVQKNTLGSLATVTNVSTEGFRLTANQRIKVGFNFTVAPTGLTTYAGVVKGPSSSAVTDTSVAFYHSSLDAYRYSSSTILDGANQMMSASFVMEAGEVACIKNNDSGDAPDTDAYQGIINVLVEKDYSHTNMAHIIKPSVCIIEQKKVANSDGDTITSGGWRDLVINSISGESWFATLSGSGTTGVGGTNVDVTFEKGMYEMTGSFPQYNGGNSKVIMVDSSGTTLAISTSEDCYANSGYAPIRNWINTVQTFTTSTELTFQMQVESNGDNGVKTNLGVDEIFNQIVVRKLK